MKNHRMLSGIIIAASLVAMFASAVLIRHHLNPEAKSGVVEAVCGQDKDSGCNKVNTSGASEVFGMPLAFWGFIFYGIMLVLAAFHLFTGEMLLVRLLFLGACIALLADFFLLIYSLVNLETVCNLCLLTYLASIAIAAASFLLLKNHEEGFHMRLNFTSLSAVKMSTRSALLSSALLVPVLAAAIFLEARVVQAQNTAAGGDDPNALIQKAAQAFVLQYRNAKVEALNTENSPAKGAAKASVQIVEFADFMCPYCRVMAGRLDNIKKRCPNLIQVVYKHYPLDKTCNDQMRNQLHDGACQLSYAAYCAGRQNRFWEMHDQIYASQGKKLTESDLVSLAGKAGISTGSFRSCLSADSTRQAVVRDISEANALGITGTPTVFMNGRKVMPVDFFMDMVAEQEAQAKFGGEQSCKP